MNDDRFTQAAVIEYIKQAQTKESEAVYALDQELEKIESQVKEIEREIKSRRQRVDAYECCLAIFDEKGHGTNSGPAEAEQKLYLDALIKRTTEH